MKQETLLRYSLSALPLIGILLLLRALFLYASVAPVSFDGAMNLNTAASLAAGTGYGFFYDNFFPFPAQTDGPYILPAAFIIWLFGISPLVTQAVNLIYIALLIPLLTVLLRRIGLPLWAALTGALAAVSVPGFTEYGMNGYGEIPALTWYIAGLILFGYSFHFSKPGLSALIGGALLAFAYLTKVVALVLVVPVLIFAAMLNFRRQLSRRTLVQFCLGFLLPILLWEWYRLFSIGSLSGYVYWWKLQLGQIFYQSGASQGLSELVAKAMEHYSILCSIIGLNTYLLFAFLTLPYLLYFFSRGNFTSGQNFYLLCMLFSGLLYFSWWLMLTPTSMAWLRRILNGIVIHQLLIFILSYRIIISNFSKPNLTKLKKWFAFFSSILGFYCIIIVSKNGENVIRPLEPPKYTSSFYEMAKLIHDLPADTLIFGTGWWQSPGLALYSGKKFYNFQRWIPEAINDRQNNKYFAFDYNAIWIAKSDIVDALALTDTKVIYQSEGGELYRIERAKYYAPLEVTADDLPKLRTKMDFAVADYEFKRGFYQIEDHKYAWMRTHGLVVLVRTNERRLIMSLVVPERLIREEAVDLRVEVPECAQETFSLSKPLDNTIEVKLNCKESSERKPLFVYLHVSRHMPFVRQIDADSPTSRRFSSLDRSNPSGRFMSRRCWLWQYLP